MYSINCLWLVTFGLLIITDIQTSLANSNEENQAYIEFILASLNKNSECHLPSFEEIDELQKSFHELALAYGPNFDLSLTKDQKLALETILYQWTSFRERMTTNIVIRSAQKRSFLNRVEKYQKNKYGYSVCSDIKNIKGPISDRIFEKNPHVRYIKHLQTNQVIDKSEKDEFLPSIVLSDETTSQKLVDAIQTPLVDTKPLTDVSVEDFSEEIQEEEPHMAPENDAESVTMNESDSTQQASDESSESGSDHIEADEISANTATAKTSDDDEMIEDTFDQSRMAQLEQSLSSASSESISSTAKTDHLDREQSTESTDEHHIDQPQDKAGEQEEDDETHHVEAAEKSPEESSEESSEESTERLPEKLSGGSPEESSAESPGESTNRSLEESSGESLASSFEQPDESGIIRRMIGQFVVDLPSSGSSKISIQFQHSYEGPSQNDDQTDDLNLENWHDPLLDIPIPSSSDYNQDAAPNDNHQPSAMFDFEAEQRGPVKPRVVEQPHLATSVEPECGEDAAGWIDAATDDANLEKLVRATPREWDFDPVYGRFQWPDEIPVREQPIELADNSILSQWMMFTNDPKQFEVYLESLRPKFDPGEVRRQKDEYRQQLHEETRIERENRRYGLYGSHGYVVGPILSAPETKSLRDRWVKLADNNFCKLDYNANYIKKVGSKVTSKIFRKKKSS